MARGFRPRRAVTVAIALLVVGVIATIGIVSANRQPPRTEPTTPPENVRFESKARYESADAHLAKALSSRGMATSSEGTPVDGADVLVMHTMVDDRYVDDGTQIDDLFEDGTYLDAIVMQFSSYVPVLDVGLDDRYVAYLDRTTENGAGRVHDADFAEDNNYGQVIDGIEYDMEHGVAYIPKSLYDDGNGGPRTIRAQLLCAFDYSDPETTRAQSVVDFHVTSDVPGVTPLSEHVWVEADPVEGVMRVPILDPQTASRVSPEDIVVRADGRQATRGVGEGLEWDPSTGELAIMTCSVPETQIEVSILGAEKAQTVLASSLGPERALAVSGSAMNAWPWGHLDMKRSDFDRLQVGAVDEYAAWLYYGLVDPSNPGDTGADWRGTAYDPVSGKSDERQFGYLNWLKDYSADYPGDGSVDLQWPYWQMMQHVQTSKICYSSDLDQSISTRHYEIINKWTGDTSQWERDADPLHTTALFGITMPADASTVSRSGVSGPLQSFAGIPLSWSNIKGYVPAGYNSNVGNAVNANLVCCHVTDPIGDVTWVNSYTSGKYGATPPPSAPAYNPVTGEMGTQRENDGRQYSGVRMRLLGKGTDAAGEYLVFGFVTERTFHQSGVGIYKFRVSVEEDYGKLTVRKVVNGPQSNRTYRIQVTFSGEGAPASRTLSLKAGESTTIENIRPGVTYAVKELDIDESGKNEWFAQVSASGVNGTMTANGSPTATITNVEYGKLSITKTVQGTSSGRTFHFTVTFSGEGAPASQSFDLAPGQTRTFSQIRAGVSYSVVEDTGDGRWYGIVSKSNDTGTIIAANTKDAAFTNVEYGEFSVKKVVDRSKIDDKSLDANRTFPIVVTLTDKSGAPVSGTFGDMTFTNGSCTLNLKDGESKVATRVPVGHKWDISETPPQGYQLNGITNDPGTVVAGRRVDSTITNIQLPGQGRLTKVTR